MSFTIGSLFDGSGGFPLAATMCGGTPKWASEIEPYPIAVTKSRFPDVKHLGSVTDIKGGEVEPVDVITFGSPCQDLSVAGKRAGLKHTDNGDDETTRSGLFMEAVRIIKEMREATNGVYPRFAVWENVPGAFSSNKGEDFRIVLEELIKVVEPTAVMPEVPKNGWPYADSYGGDGWSLAYRVLDAQYWGVPQRRRRIYLVADFRGECAGKVSFEREGLRGYFATGGTPWQTAARDAEAGFGAADCEGTALDIYNLAVTGDVAASLTTATGQGASNTGPSVIVVDQGGGKSGANFHNNLRPTPTCTHGGEPVVAYSINHQGGNVEQIIEGKTGTLTAAMNSSGNNKLSVAYGISSYESNSMKSDNPHSGIYVADTSRTLDLNGGNPACNQGGIAIVEPVVCMATQQGGAEIMEDKCPTITAAAGMSGNNQPVVCYQDMVLDDQGGSQISVRNDGKCPTLRAETHGNLPCVMNPVAFDVYNQSVTGDVTKSLTAIKSDADHVPVAVYSVENHPADSRVNIDDSGKVQTLTSRMGTGGGNVPMVMEPFTYDARGNGDGKTVSTITGGHEAFVSDFSSVVGIPIHDAPVYCLQGNGIDRADTAGCNGKGVKENICYTLNTIDRPGVAFQTYQKVTGPLMANSHPGSYTGQDAFSDMLVAGKEENPIVLDRAFFNQVENAKFDPTFYTDGTVPTLVARGPSAVAVRYIVRRLTPTECARLQGFPDTWGHPIEKTELTDEEYQFWLNVRNTHAAINDKVTKEYTKEQLLKWYNGLHTDSSEYKMWGNGIALPNALYVMQGIADVMSEEKATRRKWLKDLLGDYL